MMAIISTPARSSFRIEGRIISGLRTFYLQFASWPLFLLRVLSLQFSGICVFPRVIFFRKQRSRHSRLANHTSQSPYVSQIPFLFWETPALRATRGLRGAGFCSRLLQYHPWVLFTLAHSLERVALFSSALRSRIGRGRFAEVRPSPKRRLQFSAPARRRSKCPTTRLISLFTRLISQSSLSSPSSRAVQPATNFRKGLGLAGSASSIQHEAARETLSDETIVGRPVSTLITNISMLAVTAPLALPLVIFLISRVVTVAAHLSS